MNIVDREKALRERGAHRLIPGKGYFHAGHLPMPPKPIGPANACEPTALPAEDGSAHVLKSPHGAEMRFTWHPETREWMPPAGKGRRIGFTSACLAAHGWTYKGFV